jgi:hypothetical protein
MTMTRSGLHERQRGLTRYEFLWVCIVIGVVLTLGLGYYQRVAADAQRFALQLQARNFHQAATVVRAFWRLRAKPANSLSLNGFVYRVNAQGWPIDAHPAVSQSGNAPPALRCKRLFLSLIIAPPSATVNPPESAIGKAQPLADNGCRYDSKSAQKALYFDYNALTGGTELSGQ